MYLFCNSSITSNRYSLFTRLLSDLALVLASFNITVAIRSNLLSTSVGSLLIVNLLFCVIKSKTPSNSFGFLVTKSKLLCSASLLRTNRFNRLSLLFSTLMPPNICSITGAYSIGISLPFKVNLFLDLRSTLYFSATFLFSVKYKPQPNACVPKPPPILPKSNSSKSYGEPCHADW